MCRFRHPELKLPAPSWNLWEDRRGIHTFTCAAVGGALQAAANFALLFGDEGRYENYKQTADEIIEAMREHLYSAQLGRFLRALQFNGDEYFEPDQTIDASLFGAFYFGAFDAADEMVRGTMRAVEKHLWVNTEIGGVARFERDGYMRVSEDYAKVPGNGWFVCTLWLAEYRIAVAKSKVVLRGALEILEWTARRALRSGVLAEQVHPLDGSPVSVSPLTWSHSTYLAVVMNYLRKRAEFEPHYNPSARSAHHKH